MNPVVECEGAPRDLGVDQGRACREAVARRFAAGTAWERLRWRAGWPPDGDARRVRDLWRHFPHQADRLAGLGVAAGVPAGWLVPGVGADEGPAADAAALEGPPVRLGRALDAPFVVRRSRPEGLFASVEVTRPWLPAALVGVNERGLAVATVAGPGAAERCAAPAWLLAQDCLERFEAVEPALEWCCERPGGGGGALLLAHADGDVAGVDLGAERRVLPGGGHIVLPRGGRIVLPGGGRIVLPGGGHVVLPGDGHTVRAGESAELEKALAEVSPDAASLARALGGAAVDAGAGRLYVGDRVFSP